MFERNVIKKLTEWAESPYRKPLVLRGARQVGKTSVVELFSQQFDQYIYLNLEKQADIQIFNGSRSIESLIEMIFFVKKKIDGRKTLIFIDEIQNSPEAVAMLRYFYEHRPDLFVISAGSLLENLLDLSVSFPVGRVEFLVLHPFSFEEFLMAMNESQALDILLRDTVPEFAHETLKSLFQRYVQVGGMPEAVKRYVETRDLNRVTSVYENLITAYLEDVEKYASKDRLVPIVRHCIQTAFREVGTRIKYEGFGQSNYRSVDTKEALQLLEKAFLFQIISPVTTATVPLVPNLKKSPRIQALDTGLVTHASRMHKELFMNSDISAVYAGKIVEHIVGQELFSRGNSPLDRLGFWVREKSQSNAEVDYVVEYNGFVIPVEVKSGADGRLRSLHSFIDAAPHATAVRFYGGAISIERVNTIAGKPFTLINLPWYCAFRIDRYIELNFTKE